MHFHFFFFLFNLCLKIVAGIVEQNQTKRNIYVPAGSWNDKLRNANLTGPLLLKNYEIKLDEIAYFVRLHD